MEATRPMTVWQRALAWSGAVVAILMLALFHSMVQGQVQRSALDKATRYAQPAKAALPTSLVVVSIRE